MFDKVIKWCYCITTILSNRDHCRINLTGRRWRPNHFPVNVPGRIRLNQRVVDERRSVKPRQVIRELRHQVGPGVVALNHQEVLTDLTRRSTAVDIVRMIRKHAQVIFIF